MLLEEAIAARIGADAQDLRVGLAAGVTMAVLQMALDLHRDRLEAPSVTDLADRIMALLSGPDAILPTRTDR